MCDEILQVFVNPLVIDINCTISHNSSHISNRNQQTSSNMPEPNEDQDPISTEVTEYTSAAYTPSEEAKDEEHK
ncbi:unnamed protein product [Rotaria socialis]|uniref:Uncharacterized protein n=1 Tax=Rotaria socialis TaxID=392032 RepID=A0A818LY10_9BILA|nr:unnamed protein product [Rotaria socialis]